MAVLVGVSVGVKVAVLVGVSVGVGVLLGVEVLVGVLVGVEVGVLVGVLVGVALAVLVGGCGRMYEITNRAACEAPDSKLRAPLRAHVPVAVPLTMTDKLLPLCQPERLMTS